MDDILSERRLRWLGHVVRMDHQRIPRQAIRGVQVVRVQTGGAQDLLRMGITWEELEVAAQDRSEWRRSVAQCIHLDAD